MGVTRSIDNWTDGNGKLSRSMKSWTDGNGRETADEDDLHLVLRVDTRESQVNANFAPTLRLLFDHCSLLTIF